MALALADNPRTRIRATIKRASARARVNMNAVDRDILQQLDAIYRRAAEDLDSQLQFYAGSDNTLRLESLVDIRQQIDQLVNNIRSERNRLLDGGLATAVSEGVAPYRSATNASTLTRVADNSLRFVRSFVAEDGLQLSDRLWRLDNGARQALTSHIESAIIQGWSASEAANRLLIDGQSVPADLRDKIGAANVDTISRNARRALLTGDGNPRANAMRVFRTEINRAHGEAYMAGGENVDGFAGWKFLLSPRHPEADICDMHARANLYGLGPGVYPSRQRCPWPAHPNTLSYVEIVFEDEITAEDRAGKTNRLDWLKGQPASVQRAVLGASQKRVALQNGILSENEIATPWKVLKKRYEGKGIDTSALTIKPPKPPQIQGTVVTGIDPGELKDYIDTAWKDAPESILKAIDKAPRVKAINVMPSGTSYYYNGGIALSRTSMQPRSWAPSIHDVYRHEYGHFFDFHSGRQISLLENKKGGLGDSMARAKRSLYARGEKQKARLARINEEIDRRNDGYLADLFGSLSMNRVGWGHAVSYLRRTGYPETEAFANLFNIYSRADRSAWEFVQQELPELARDFEAHIENFIGD